MKCPNCGVEMNLYFTKKSFLIDKCRGCSLMAVENVPGDLAPFYAKGYFTGDVTLDGYMDYDLDKQVTISTYESFLNDIHLYLQGSEKVSMLEVGCATGFFMELAKKRGWEVEGIDISAYAVEQAKKKGLKASVSTLEDFHNDKRFSVIVMQDVIEHVKDPISLVKKAHGLLEEKGLIALTTPDSGSFWARVWGKHWHAFVPPQHLFYFNSKNLTDTLEKNGYKVLYLKHHGKWFTIPYILRLLYSWTGLKVFSSIAEGVSKTFVRKIALPINVRDTIYCIAIKK